MQRKKRKRKSRVNVTEARPRVFKVRWWEGGRGGRYRQVTLKNVTKEEAEAYYFRKVSAARAGMVSPEHVNISFSALAKQYRGKYLPTLAPSWQANVNLYLDKRLVPFFGRLVAAKITPGSVLEYRTLRLKELTASGKPPAAESINHEVRCLKAVLAFGVSERLLERHPLPPRSVKPLSVPTEAERADVYFTPEEWGKFERVFDDPKTWDAYVVHVRRFGPEVYRPDLGTVRRHGGSLKPGSEAAEALRLRLKSSIPVFKAVLLTGSRIGEILGLRWKDIDRKRGIVTIFQPKTKRAKVQPLSPELVEILEGLPRGIGDAPVFQRPGGGAWDKAKIERAYRVARKLSGIRQVLRIHDLRHAAGTWLTLAGQPDRLVQSFLGHSSPASTRRYQHALTQHLEAAAGIIATAAAGGTAKPPGERIGEREAKVAKKRKSVTR